MSRPADESRQRNGHEGALRLRPRPHGLSAYQVVEIQRARLLSAMIGIGCEQGLAAVTVAKATGRAGVSRRTFYELFSDRDDCLLAVFDETVARVASSMQAAYGRRGSWTDRVRASLLELLAFVEQERELATLCGAIAQTEESRALDRRSDLVVALTHALDEGRVGQPRAWPPPLTAECLIGAAEGLIRSRLRERPQTPVLNLVGPLMSLILLPYRGSAAARRELSRPLPEAALPMAAPPLSVSNRLDVLSFRFTYRTLRVLDAVDQQPDASNCEVATAAGVKDQGQISKLLARLKRLELVTDDRAPGDRRSTNAWRLTPLGEQLHQAMTAQLKHVRSSANGHGGAHRLPRDAGAGDGLERRSG
jgi:AcrR family transcriptional regulator/DNA-binding MarR family transcriptional regulator